MKEYQEAEETIPRSFMKGPQRPHGLKLGCKIFGYSYSYYSYFLCVFSKMDLKGLAEKGCKTLCLTLIEKFCAAGLMFGLVEFKSRF